MEHKISFKNWIGKTLKTKPELISPRLVESFKATFSDNLAKIAGAPAGLHWCVTPPILNIEELGSDGHPIKGSFIPPIPLPRRMWASGTVEFHDDLLVADIVQKHSKIKEIFWKNGRSGQLCFVTVSNDYITTRGTVITEDQNIVFREAAKGPMINPKPVMSEKIFQIEKLVPISEVHLFRYSAITFNAHRIHYDLPYTRDVEFYPDLVIHGPLQATLILNLATGIMNKLPRRFSFRGLAPATGAQTLRLGANIFGQKCELSVIDEQGVETMTGSAEW